ncbi:hypothetical protein ACWC1D_30290 [Streptomyces sp. NPDC001478]
MSGVTVVGQPVARQRLSDLAGGTGAGTETGGGTGLGGDGAGPGAGASGLGVGGTGPGVGGSGPGGGVTGPGGGDELRHSEGPWLRAAGGAEAMNAHLGPVRTDLATAHAGLSAGTVGLTALAELGAVRESWQRRFDAARHECAFLAAGLRAVARAQGETDASVNASFAPVMTGRDAGGRGGGRGRGFEGLTR